MNIIPGESAHSSLIGDRKINQDRCIQIREGDTALLGLADGMGGHPRGEVAAQLLIDTCQNYFSLTPHPILNPSSFLTRLLHKAHEDIVAFGYDQQPAIDPRTTAVACLIQKNVAHWAHAGDSRLYLLREMRVLSRTVDHSYVERLKQQGVISAEEQEAHPQRNYVTRCLGGSLASPDITLGKHKLQAGDILLLCSDGFWGSVDEAHMLSSLFSRSHSPRRCRAWPRKRPIMPFRTATISRCWRSGWRPGRSGPRPSGKPNSANRKREQSGPGHCRVAKCHQ